MEFVPLQKSSLSLESEFARDLIVNFPASRIMEKETLLLLSYTGCGFLIIAQEHTDTLQ